MSENQTADRTMIREIIDLYAHHADRREADKQVALFTEDMHVAVYMGKEPDGEPAQDIRGQAELKPGFEALSQYMYTMHFVGQNTLTLDGDSATGEVYTLAHHVSEKDGRRVLLVMAIRYYDTYVKQNGKWLFAERLLLIDWTDERPLNA